MIHLYCVAFRDSQFKDWSKLLIKTGNIGLSNFWVNTPRVSQIHYSNIFSDQKICLFHFVSLSSNIYFNLFFFPSSIYITEILYALVRPSSFRFASARVEASKLQTEGEGLQGGFLKWGYPQFSSILIGCVIQNHPASLGYPHFRKPPSLYYIYYKGQLLSDINPLRTTTS